MICLYGMGNEIFHKIYLLGYDHSIIVLTKLVRNSFCKMQYKMSGEKRWFIGNEQYYDLYTSIF